MIFCGVIDRVSYLGGNISIRLVQDSLMLLECREKPVRIIEIEGVKEPFGDITLLQGAAIDGYELSDGRIVFWVCWPDPNTPLEFSGSRCVCRDEDYSRQDYLNAIRQANQAFERQGQELSDYRNKLKKIEVFIDKETHRLLQKCELQPKKEEIHLKLIDILERLRSLTGS